jgi:mycothiol synthase
MRCPPEAIRAHLADRFRIVHLPDTLRVERVDSANAGQLADYALAHGPEHDESYLPGRDFDLSVDFPAYLLLREAQTVGAVVLMRSPRYLSVGRGRFSVFHSVEPSPETYAALLDAARLHFEGLRAVYLFIPQDRHPVASILSRLGFHIERYSHVLENRETTPPPEARFPGGYEVRPLVGSDAAGIAQFVRCLNDSFSELAGHTDFTARDIRAWFDHEHYLEGGICLLLHGAQPVGTLCVMREHETRAAAEVLAFGILKAHRRKGLGRALLCYARKFALQQGLHSVILSVNAENDRALGLYEGEGFQPIETTVCYALDCA